MHDVKCLRAFFTYKIQVKQIYTIKTVVGVFKNKRYFAIVTGRTKLVQLCTGTVRIYHDDEILPCP